MGRGQERWRNGSGNAAGLMTLPAARSKNAADCGSLELPIGAWHLCLGKFPLVGRSVGVFVRKQESRGSTRSKAFADDRIGLQ